jgi:hypothetical protein
LNGDDLRRDPLEVRKATLASILAKAEIIRSVKEVRAWLPEADTSRRSSCPPSKNDPGAFSNPSTMASIRQHCARTRLVSRRNPRR